MVKWLCTVILVTIFAALIYGSIQHVLRMSANNPQIQLAEDYAQSLSEGQQVSLSNQKVNIAKSLATFIIVYDSSQNVISSSAVLDGKTPSLPEGVFDFAKKNGENRFTWQPRSGVRSASVLMYFSGKKEGYVLAGRSLREVEKRENDLLIEVFTAWILGLVFATIPFVVKHRKH